MDIDDTTPCQFAHPPTDPGRASASLPRVPIWESAQVHDGEARASACLIDLSSKGVLVRTALSLEPGDEIVMNVHLSQEIAQLAGIELLRLDLAVIAATGSEPDEFGKWYYRCRQLASSGTPAHSRVATVIIAAFEYNERLRIAS